MRVLSRSDEKRLRALLRAAGGDYNSVLRVLREASQHPPASFDELIAKLKEGQKKHAGAAFAGTAVGTEDHVASR